MVEVSVEGLAVSQRLFVGFDVVSFFCQTWLVNRRDSEN